MLLALKFTQSATTKQVPHTNQFPTAHEIFNSFSSQFHRKWLKWAIAFHIARLLDEHLATIRIGFSLELYSTNMNQRDR
jgi:hypothetical protein